MNQVNLNPIQNKLSKKQVEAFYSDRLANEQVDHFFKLIGKVYPARIRQVVDIGGGCGHFARQLVERESFRARVIDSDQTSIGLCKKNYDGYIFCDLGDAISPHIQEPDDVVCFNLILHHLVAGSESETAELQKKALSAWRLQAKVLFINEYVYDSFLGNASGWLIYQITKSPVLSFFGKLASFFAPSLKANTFGTGVRFRSHSEWMKLFDECGFSVATTVRGRAESISIPRRLLLISRKSRDYFLITPKPEM